MKKLSKPRQKFRRRKAKPYLIKDQKNDSQKVETQIDENKQREMIKRRYRTIEALGCFVISIIIGYAPQYIETNNALVVNASQYGGFLFLMIGLYIMHRVYPNISDSEKAVYISMPIIAIVFYCASTDPSVVQKMPLGTRQYFRVISFIALLCTILMLMSKLPRLLDSYERNKGNIKALFKVKNIPGLILGILTMGTALFQFLQVLLSFFHH